MISHQIEEELAAKLARDLAAREKAFEAREATIRRELAGNLRRCTGYQNIVRAVRRAADLMDRR